MKKYCTLLMLILFFQNLNGQDCCPYLESLELQPSMPTTADSIFLNVKLATPGLGQFLSYEVEETDTLTTINACYSSGPLAAIQNYDQTFNLGVRESGLFKVKFVGWISTSDTICTFIQNQSMDLEINVEGINSIYEIGDFSKTEIFPNPVHADEVTISSDKEFDTIQIYDGIGKLVTKHLQNPNRSTQLKINHLPHGVYIVKGMLDSNVVFSEKLIKN